MRWQHINTIYQRFQNHRRAQTKGFTDPSRSIEDAPGIRVNRFSLCQQVSVRETSTILDHLMAVLEILNTVRLKLKRDILTQAHSRTPEDPKHPDHPVTPQIKENDKGGKKENDPRDKKKKKKKNEGRKEQNTGVEPTETFTSTRSNHVETELTYKDTTEVLGVLTTCLVCLEHAAIKEGVTGGYEGWRSQQGVDCRQIQTRSNSSQLNNGIRGKLTSWFTELPLKWIKSGWSDTTASRL